MEGGIIMTIAMVHIRSCLQQSSHHLNVPIFGGLVEGGITIIIAMAHIRSSSKQGLDYLEVPML